MVTPIPQPPGWPIIGNLLDSSPRSQFYAKYGPIFQLERWGEKQPKVYVGSVELLNEICNERKFVKTASSGGLFQVRNLTGDGLFTAFHGEENWELAHRILMPVLSNTAIKNMFDEMHDISCQLVLKWARLDFGTKIAVTDDFTRLTLDTIALCTMNTRFNSFYSETPHPFISSMVSFLTESGMRAFRSSFLTNYVYRGANQKYWENVKFMREIARQVIETRRGRPSQKKDLVSSMVHGMDPKTGKMLPEENIIDNMITFLIAGHETTSGLLSFVLYELIKNPEAMNTARSEVDAILRGGILTQTMLSQLPYITAVIRETLRLHPTAPAFAVTGKSDNPRDYPIFIGKEKYPVYKDQVLLAMLSEIHRDPLVYGCDADCFKPERMLSESFNKLPKGAWKPFGNGARGCIGRAFALQEATMIIALLLQNFEFELADPDYQLSISKTLTIKPKDFEVCVKPRDNLNPTTIQRRLLRGDFNGLHQHQSTH